MITKIKNICKRLRLAYQIVRGYKCYYLGFADDNIPNERVYVVAAMDAAEEYLRMKLGITEGFYARRNIIRHALVTEASILTQYKIGNNCYMSCDCNSEEDLSELLNQDIR